MGSGFSSTYASSSPVRMVPHRMHIVASFRFICVPRGNRRHPAKKRHIGGILPRFGIGNMPRRQWHDSRDAFPKEFHVPARDTPYNEQNLCADIAGVPRVLSEATPSTTAAHCS
jgi:hypothetical protein